MKMPRQDDRRYRPNVAFLLRNARGQILIGERADQPGSWQCPQGGVKRREALAEALIREVREEIGLPPSAYHVLSERGPYRYRFPKGYKKGPYAGQSQTWFLAELADPSAAICIDTKNPEFRAFRWILPGTLDLRWLPPMKRLVYLRVFFDFFGVTLLHPGTGQ